MGRAIRETLEVVVLALLMFVGLQASVQNFRVEGSSMDPTLETGQYLLVNKLLYLYFDLARVEAFLPTVEYQEANTIYPFHPPERGNVIVFRPPFDTQRDFVKRVIALPGETIAIREGVTYINGELLEEPYLKVRSLKAQEPFTVPRSTYFVMGDNRSHSNDSRDWGPVPVENIIGKVWVTYWPPSKASILR